MREKLIKRRFTALLLCAGALAGCFHEEGPTAEDYLERARVRVDSGAYTAGVIELKNALNKNPGLTEARVLLGQTYIKLSDGLGAEKEILYARDLGRFGHAERVALIEARLLINEPVAALAEIPDPIYGSDAEITALHILRGKALLATGDLRTANEDFEIALARGQAAPAYAGLVRVAVASQDLSGADIRLTNGLALFPADPDLLILNGERLLRADDFSAAETEFETAIATDESNRTLSGRIGLARALIAQDKLEEAKTTLGSVVDRMPENGTAMLLNAYVSMRLKDYLTAKILADQVINSNQHNLMAIGVAGVASYFLEQYEQANLLISQYVSRAPQDNEVLQVLAATKLQLGAPATADTLLRSANKLDADSMSFRTLAGYSAILSGRPRDGVRHLARAVEINPRDVGARIRLGTVQAAAGQPDDAEVELRRALDLDPSIELSPEMHGAKKEFISALIRERRFEEALASALEMQQTRPDLKDGYVLAGIAYGGMQRETEARVQFHKARDVVPGAPDASTNLAMMELRNGNLNQAKTYLQDVIAHFPGHYNTLVSLAALEAQQNNAARTQQFLARALLARPEKLPARIFLTRFYMGQGDTARALEVGKPGLIYHAENVQLLSLVAKAQMETGQTGDSILTLQKLVALESDAINTRLMLADAYRRAGNRRAVRWTLQEVLSIAPDNLPANLAMARLMLAGRDTTGASEIIERLAPAYPDNGDMLQLRGQVALSQDRPSDAVAHFSAARNVANNRITTLGLAGALWQANKAQHALATLDEWLSSKPRDGLARMQLVKYLQALNHRDLAKRHLAAAIEINPRFWIAHNDLAWMLYNEGDHNGAVKHAEQALNLAPQNPFVMDTLGVIRLAQNDTFGAVELLRAAFELRPTNQDIGFHLAQALAQNGEDSSARRTLAKILASDRAFENREAAETLLTELDG